LVQAVEETLDKVVRLLAYIADKDLFAEFYRKKLSRRLLFDKVRSVSVRLRKTVPRVCSPHHRVCGAPQHEVHVAALGER
jgi:hypothetical protein